MPRRLAFFSCLLLWCCVLSSVTACRKGDRDSGVADGGLDAAATDTGVGSDAAVGTDATAATDAAATDAASAGRLTIEASGITGAVGDVVLVFVSATGGGPLLGAICEPVTADPGSVSAIAAVPGMMGNPCALGAEVVFDNGSYDLSGGVYTPGSMMPNQCSTTTVTVAGDTTATMPAFGACP